MDSLDMPTLMGPCLAAAAGGGGPSMSPFIVQAMYTDPREIMTRLDGTLITYGDVAAISWASWKVAILSLPNLASSLAQFFIGDFADARGRKYAMMTGFTFMNVGLVISLMSNFFVPSLEEVQEHVARYPDLDDKMSEFNLQAGLVAIGAFITGLGNGMVGPNQMLFAVEGYREKAYQMRTTMVMTFQAIGMALPAMIATVSGACTGNGAVNASCQVLGMLIYCIIGECFQGAAPDTPLSYEASMKRIRKKVQRLERREEMRQCVIAGEDKAVAKAKYLNEEKTWTTSQLLAFCWVTTISSLNQMVGWGFIALTPFLVTSVFDGHNYKGVPYFQIGWQSLPNAFVMIIAMGGAILISRRFNINPRRGIIVYSTPLLILTLAAGLMYTFDVNPIIIFVVYTIISGNLVMVCIPVFSLAVVAFTDANKARGASLSGAIAKIAASIAGSLYPMFLTLDVDAEGLPTNECLSWLMYLTLGLLLCSVFLASFFKVKMQPTAHSPKAGLEIVIHPEDGYVQEVNADMVVHPSMDDMTKGLYHSDVLHTSRFDILAKTQTARTSYLDPTPLPKPPNLPMLPNPEVALGSSWLRVGSTEIERARREASLHRGSIEGCSIMVGVSKSEPPMQSLLCAPMYDNGRIVVSPAIAPLFENRVDQPPKSKSKATKPKVVEHSESSDSYDYSRNGSFAPPMFVPIRSGSSATRSWENG